MTTVQTRASFAVLLWLGCAACNPTLPPPAVPAPPPSSYQTAQSRLMLYPEANAESLLGRAVQVSSDGTWTMADSRAPGCEVNVTHQKAHFHSSRRVAARSMTAFAGNYAALVSLQAKFGQENKADIDVENTEVLHADTRGACGEYVIDTIFVGHGSRKISGSAEESGSASLHVGLANAAPSVDAGQSLVDAIEWQDDQAYGFSARAMSKQQPLQLNVAIPSSVSDGDEVQVSFETELHAWLVVYYIDAEGKAEVLWPSDEEPAPQATRGHPAILPSARERAAGIKIQAALVDHRVKTRECLVVYGFVDQRDFDALKPSAGAERSDGAAYAAELTKKLQFVPMSRWSRAVVGYEIVPSAK